MEGVFLVMAAIVFCFMHQGQRLCYDMYKVWCPTMACHFDTPC